MKSGIKIKGLKKLQKNLQPDAFIDRALPDKFDLECPSCKKVFKARQGSNKCPHCGETVDFSVDIKK